MIGKTGKRGDLQIASMGNLVKLGDFLRNIAMFYILKKQLGFKNHFHQSFQNPQSPNDCKLMEKTEF